MHTCILTCSGTGKRFSNRKETKLSSSAECRIRTQRVFGTESPADWIPADKPTELSRIKLKTWTRQPVPMISAHSTHSTPLPVGIRTWLWRYTCFVVVNFDALAQASDIRIETSCFPLLNAGFEPRVSNTKSSADRMPADTPTELSSIKLKTWTRQPVPTISKHSAHSIKLPVGFRTWLWRYTCLLLLISMRWHRQAIFEGDKLSSSAECRIRIQGPRHQIASILNARWQTDWAIEDQAKNLTNRQTCITF